MCLGNCWGKKKKKKHLARHYVADTYNYRDAGTMACGVEKINAKRFRTHLR